MIRRWLKAASLRGPAQTGCVAFGRYLLGDVAGAWSWLRVLDDDHLVYLERRAEQFSKWVALKRSQRAVRES